jgi:hypothetical protein
VAGAKGAGKSLLIAALEKAIGDGDLERVKAKLLQAGREPSLADRLALISFLEVPGFRAQPGPDTSRERSSRKDAVAAAGEADLLVLVADASRGDLSDDLNFAREWIDAYKERPHQDLPPALVVVTGFGRLGETPEVETPSGGSGGGSIGTRARPLSREEAINALKAELPEGINRVVAVELEDQPPADVAEAVLPSLARRVPEAERLALLRHLHRHSTRSKARRVVESIGSQGKFLWRSVRSRTAGRADDSDD